MRLPKVYYPESFNASHQFRVSGVLMDCVRLVDERYGVNGSRLELDFHNADHTIDVIESCSALGKLALDRGRLGSEDYCNLLFAGAGHDLTHGLSEKFLNERRSFEELQVIMKRWNFKKHADHEMVEAILMSTRMFYENGVLKQKPTEAAGYAGLLLADADLSSLGSPLDIFRSSIQRYKSEVGESREMKFLLDEIAFLNGHEYFTSEARESYPHKRENLAWLATQTDCLAVQ